MDVKIDKIHQLTASIRAFELVSHGSDPLPTFRAGAHIDVHLKNGLTRQYSISNSATEKHRYVIAVLNDENSRGGSCSIHSDYQEGDLLCISEPRNLFELHPQTQKAILFAGGIGITPILSMAYQLKSQRIPFELHYFVRNHEMIAFYGNLTTHFAENIHFHLQDQTETACNLSAILQKPSPEKHLYVCGPTGFMQYVMNAATTEGWQSSELHQEHFVAQNLSQHDDQAFTIEILGSEQKIEVSTQQTAMQALIENGFDIPISCEQGICGTCITRVVSGIPDHRDLFMTDEEHALNDQFTPCCSRAKSKILVLDLS